MLHPLEVPGFGCVLRSLLCIKSWQRLCLSKQTVVVRRYGRHDAEHEGSCIGL